MDTVIEIPAHASDDALDRIARDFAERAGALAELLARWRRPAVARAVIASLLADDDDIFRELLRDFDPPVLAKCWWVRDVIERIVSRSEQRSVCRLRSDLSPGERALYLQIVLRSGGAATVLAAAGGPLDMTGGRGPEIPPGPLLDALNAAGLVVCTSEAVEAAGLQQVLARPARMCV